MRRYHVIRFQDSPAVANFLQAMLDYVAGHRVLEAATEPCEILGPAPGLMVGRHADTRLYLTDAALRLARQAGLSFPAPEAQVPVDQLPQTHSVALRC